MSTGALRAAIGSEDVARLRSVPGIGQKTARKIILELKDRFGVAEGMPESLAALSEADAQVIEALTSLGYSIVEAQRAVQNVPADVTEVEERLRLALASLG
jgi:Holliday junction DNA helicase RuvA